MSCRRHRWRRWCAASSGASRRRASPTSSATPAKKDTCKPLHSLQSSPRADRTPPRLRLRFRFDSDPSALLLLRSLIRREYSLFVADLTACLYIDLPFSIRLRFFLRCAVALGKSKLGFLAEIDQSSLDTFESRFLPRLWCQ